MNKKAVLLLSGGLDSTLALRILQEQGIEIEALNFRTSFSCCKEEALETARRFGVKVTVVSTQDDYFKLIEKPKYGWGKGINPCIDCRIYMFRLAKKFMDTVGASFVVSGEVLGQRPMSQQAHQLRIIEQDSGLADILLRPLSAKFLEPTRPEIEGIVDREKLYGISGRSRKELIDLAHQFGIEEPPTPSTGCLLTEPDFAKRVRDHFKHDEDRDRWHFETLKVGRHFRLNDDVKVIVGRNEEENKRLEILNQRDSALLIPISYKGASALIIGPCGEEVEAKACGLIYHFSKNAKNWEGSHAFEKRQNGKSGRFEWQAASVPDEEIAGLKI